MFETLFKAAVTGVRTLITNARIGKQVLQTGATVSTQVTGAGTNTQVTSAGSVGLPTWLMPVALVTGGIILLAIVGKFILKLFK